MTEGVFPKIDGDVLFASEANMLEPVKQIYTGTGYDSTFTGVGNATGTFELNALTAAEIKGATHLKIEVTGKTMNDNGGGSESKVEYQIETKEIGGVYSDSLPLEIIRSNNDATTSQRTRDLSFTFIHYHTLTAGELTNGVQVRMNSKSTQIAASNTSSFTNHQTVLSIVKVM